MESIIIHCTSKECEEIERGDLTLLIRKSAPKQVPFKAYIYKSKYRCGNKIINGALDEVYSGGKVVGSFICDKIYKINIKANCETSLGDKWNLNIIAKQSCLKLEELKNYLLYRRNGLGLHITEREFYDKPKELSVFRRPLICLEKVRTYNQELGYDCLVCDGCMYAYWDKKHLVKCSNPNCRYANLSTVQGAWQYVEEI